MEASPLPSLILHHSTQKPVHQWQKKTNLKDHKNQRSRTWLQGAQHCASLRHHFEDFENDAFVRRVSLFSQAALKTQGAVPVPEKAIWTSNSCGPGQLNASLIVITWCNDSQSKYSLQAITRRTRGTHYVLHYVSPTESEQCSMKKFPPRYCDSLGDREELFRVVIHPKRNSL